jgi:hypothetical protein
MILACRFVLGSSTEPLRGMDQMDYLQPKNVITDYVISPMCTSTSSWLDPILYS